MPDLKDAVVALDHLYLDPNNIRYAAIDAVQQIPPGKIRDEAVQRKALERLLQELFDVRSLKRSIATSGFFPIDRLIVVELPPDNGAYVVVEGNRRLAAMKTLTEDVAAGEVTVTDAVRRSITDIPVVIVGGKDWNERINTAHILQGVRHVSSIKDWVPYAKAQLIPQMEADGRSLKEIREALGLTTAQINTFRRVLAAMRQMQADPEFGEYVKPRLWGHFEEALKKPEIKTWLGWDEEQLAMTNAEHRELFFQWCVGSEEDGERLPPKLPDAKDIRKLPAVIEDSTAFKRFREDPKMSVDDAWRMAPDEESEVDWRELLKENVRTLEHVPAIELERGDRDDRALIEAVKALCDTLLKHMPK